MSTTVLPTCVCCGRNFSPEKGVYDPRSNFGSCLGCKDILPHTGKTVNAVFAALYVVPGNRKRHMFEAKRLCNCPSRVAPKASDERKLAQARNHARVCKGTKPSGKPFPLARDTYRDRREYLTAWDLRRPEEITLDQPAPTSDSGSGKPRFWPFKDANGEEVLPIQSALGRFVDTKAPGLSLDAFVNYFDPAVVDDVDPIAVINDLGDMELLAQQGDQLYAPPCMRFYRNIDEQARQAASLE